MQDCVRGVVMAHHAGSVTHTLHRRMRLPNRGPVLTKVTGMTMHLKMSQQLPVMTLPLPLSMFLPTVRSWNVVSDTTLWTPFCSHSVSGQKV
jgi:hypothetical protein